MKLKSFIFTVLILTFTNNLYAQCDKSHTATFADHVSATIDSEVEFTFYDKNSGECTFYINVTDNEDADNVIRNLELAFSRQEELHFHTDWIELIESNVRFFAIKNSDYTMIDYNRKEAKIRLVLFDADLDLYLTEDNFYILYDKSSLIKIFEKGMDGGSEIFERYGYSLTTIDGRRAYFKTFDYNGEEIRSLIAFWGGSLILYYLNESENYPDFIGNSLQTLKNEIEDYYIGSSGTERIYHDRSSGFAFGISMDSSRMYVQVKRPD